MVIASKDWIENVENSKPLLGTSGLIMASPESNTINSTDNNTTKNDWKQQQANRNCNRSNNKTPECARAILICQPNSHPFQTRTLYLESSQEVKVGRSIARNRVSENNAIFDCKVLSRNHAVIWYSDKKFYVKDTRSSNGTFINDRRINQAEEEELQSGDVVKFGVDVVENARKEVHGCIIASVKLYWPDGREFISNKSSRQISGQGTISLDEMCRLHHYMQEAVQREQILEMKLHDIQKVIDMTRRNTATCWQAMIDEDRLLNRIDILENKLQFFQKNVSEDRLRDEIVKLQEDKYVYQNSAKEALRKVHQERMDAMQKLATIERALCSSEDECSLLRDQLLRTQQNLQEVNNRLSRFETECKEYRENNEKVQNQVQKENDEVELIYKDQLQQKESECQKFRAQVSILLKEKDSLQQRLNQQDTEHCGSEEEEDEETISKNSKTSSKHTIMKWLENSDLKDKDGCADIMKAICNDRESNDEDEESNNELTKINEKILSVEKIIDQFDESLEDEEIEETDENCTNSSAVSDGNQNVKTQSDLQALVKTTTSSLKEIYSDIHQYVNSLRRDIRSNESYSELEAKLNCVQEELRILQIELQTRPSYNQFQEKIVLNEQTQAELDSFKIKYNRMEDEVSKLEEENKLLRLEKELKCDSTSEKENQKSTSSQTDSICISEQTENDSSCLNATEITEDVEGYQRDIAIINSSRMQYEEELILYKTKCESVTNENLELKKNITRLESNLRDCEKQIITKFATCGAVFIAFIVYILFSYS